MMDGTQLDLEWHHAEEPTLPTDGHSGAAPSTSQPATPPTTPECLVSI